MTTADRILTHRIRQSPEFDRPELSVVVPLFDEQESLPELIRRLRHAIDADAEIVFVNDGSRDRTPAMLDELAAADPRITVVHFSRNFGHQPAIAAGLAHARGQAVAILDGDLQDPPELLPAMLDAWRGGADVVYGERRRRRANPLKKLAYASFYRLLKRAAAIDIPLDAGDFGLMDRKVVDAILAMPERSRFVRGLRAYVGFTQVGLPYDRPDRDAGESKYGMRKLLRLALDGLFDFSSAPIAMIGWLAAIMVVITSSLGIAAVSYHSSTLALAAAVTGTGTAVIGSLAIVGEYVRKVFVEVKGRPSYVVKSVVRRSTPSDAFNRAA